MAESSIKTVDELKKILSEEVRIELRARIDESLSSKLYHFCSLAAAENILKDGRFHLSHVDRHKTESGLARKVSNREKAVFPFKKRVFSISELPNTEDDGAIYKVKTPEDGSPKNACYMFKNGTWQYLPGSENANKPEAIAKKGAVMSTRMNDGRVSYVRKSEDLKGVYYMCFSRVPGAFDGYSGRMSVNKWRGVYVRFSINGNILNARYKGGPVNYYTDSSKIKKNDKLINSPTAYAQKGNASRFDSVTRPTTQAMGSDFALQIDRIKAYEHEDRLFSNEQDIPSKKRGNDNIFNTGIVERIDIFVDRKYLEGGDFDSTYILDQLGNVLQLCKRYGELKKVHIYDVEKGLSLLPIQNEIEKAETQYAKNKLYAKFKDYIELNRAEMQRVCNDVNVVREEKPSNSDISLMATLIGYLCYGNANGDKQYLKMAKSLIKQYRLTKFSDEILQNLPSIQYFDDKKEEGYWGFTFKTFIEIINNLQGWKIQKIGDNLRQMMRDYASKANLKSGIGGIKTHKLKQWRKRHEIAANRPLYDAPFGLNDNERM